MNIALPALAAFFLRIGATAFGGPVAVTNKIRQEMVDRRGILDASAFREALTLAHLMPGPLAIQVAIYIGWKLRGIAGGSLAGICFVLPSFIMTVAIAWIYVAWSGLSLISAAFHGVAAAVSALVMVNSGQLARGLLGKDRLLWLLAIVAGTLTLARIGSPLAIFLGAGAVNAVAKVQDFKPRKTMNIVLLLATGGILALLLASSGSATEVTLQDQHFTGFKPSLLEIFAFFFKSGALIFGSGLVIIPFIRDPLIHDLKWLTHQEFVDAVAVGFMTPGPALITVAFIGFLVRGFAGAVAGSVGIFLPSWFITLGAAPFYQRIIRHRIVEHAVGGISAAAVGAIASAGLVIARDSVTDTVTWIIAICSLIALVRSRKVPEGILILIAAIAGVLAAIPQ